MAMKMKGIYKNFKSVSQMFVVKERDMEIGYPTDVKHVGHIGCEGSSGSAPGWMSEFKAEEEIFSPRALSFSHARDSNSFFTTSSDFDQGSSQLATSDKLKDLPPIPVDVPKIQIKSKNRRKKSSSSTSSPRSKLSPKSSKSMGLSKSSYKSIISRLNSNA